MKSRFLWFALLLCAAPLAAQVGYLPSASPYREIHNDRWIEFDAGRLYGNGGPLLVGPRDGQAFGGRIIFRGKSTLQISLGGWEAATVRFVVDANDSVATRVKGPVDEHLFGGEATITFNVTGGKTWHGLAPFAAIGLGLVHGQAPPASDTSGYSFGTKFYFGPSIGTRVLLGQRVFFKAEARAMFWSLSYPFTYSQEPSAQPGTLTAPNAVNTTGKTSQYTLTPALFFGLGFAF